MIGVCIGAVVGVVLGNVLWDHVIDPWLAKRRVDKLTDQAERLARRKW